MKKVFLERPINCEVVVDNEHGKLFAVFCKISFLENFHRRTSTKNALKKKRNNKWKSVIPRKIQIKRRKS